VVLVVRKKKLVLFFFHYTTPGTIYPFEAKKGKSAVYQNQKWTLKVKILNPKQVFYTSKDGTKNPNDDYL
jgi:prolyl oligopeptidase